VGGRRKRTPDLVRVTCTAQDHRDTEEFGRQGFHLLCLAELAPLETGGFTLLERGISSAEMTRVKPALIVRELGHGAWTYRFKCAGRRGCGDDPQVHEDTLVASVTALFQLAREKDPRASRIDLDITWLTGHHMA
jgi:hypothetical protein